MRREPGVFPGQDAALVSDELAEQSSVLEIESIDREIDFRFRARGARFHRAAAAPFVLIWMRFPWHNLLDFAVQSVTAEERIEFLQFHFLGFKFLVASGHVAGRGLAFLARFGALDGYDLTWHKKYG